MAVVHQTTLVPGKLELLTTWLPRQDWYAGEPTGPSLARAGGFRLDDPAGEVGIEFMVLEQVRARRLSPVTDGATQPGAGEVTGLWTATDGTLVRSLFAAAVPLID